MTLRVITVDDEALALRRLEIILGAFAGIVHVGAARGCAQALKLIAEKQPDVVLLDIRMRDGSGFDVIDALPPEQAPVVIFVTAFDDYAARAFEINAVDYVLKPVSTERLHQALERARATIETKTAADRILELRNVVDNLRERLRDASDRRPDVEFWVRRNATDFVRVEAASIEYVTAEDDYVRLHTASHSYLLRETIRGMSERLDPEQFVRIHRSTLVRLGAITNVRRATVSGLEVEVTGGLRLRAGRVHAKSLRRILTGA